MNKRRGYKLSYELCKEVALKYNTKVSLQRGDASVYGKIRTSKWYELFSHMTELQKPFGYWTKERCHEESLKYKTKVDLQKGNGTVYNIIRLNGWGDELFSHMIELLKPNGYWTKERCREEALKYTRRVDFQKNSPAYSAAQRRGWVNEICSHMPEILKPTGYWNDKERCREEALKYTTRKDFVKLSSGAYNASYINGWLDEVCSHMDYIFRPNGYWTYEKCKEESLKYTNRRDFRENSHAYNVIIKNEWWDEMCNHIVETKKPKGYWTYDTCKETALRYTNRHELSINEGACYSFIMRNKWDELLSHMKRKMTLKERVIYSYEFPDNNMVYVGLTCQIERRHNAHMGKERRYGKVVSSVYNLMTKTGEIPKLKILTKRPVKEENAPNSEEYYIKKYKENGWNLLNKAKAGSLGSIHKWSKEKLKPICDSCNKVSELKNKIPTWAFYTMKENNWYDELTSHMEQDIRKGWTDKEALEIAYRYDTISLLQKDYNGVAKYIRKRPELRKELDIHWNKRKIEIEESKHPTKEECINTALKYTLRTEFRDNDRRIFEFSQNAGWLDEICSHMSRTYWTYDRCKEESLKYQYKCDLCEFSKGCYNVIYNNRWFELLSHMSQRKPTNNGEYKGKYTKDMLVELSLKCNHRSEFQDRYSGAYKAAKKLGLMDELFPITN